LGKNHEKAFTLIETALSLLLGAIILTSLAMAMQISSKKWQERVQKNSIMPHARNAMYRMTTELKYATELIRAEEDITCGYLEFKTTVLEDENPDEEVILYLYNKSFDLLYRQVDGSEGQYPILAGYPSDILVTHCLFTAMKLDGNNNLTPLVRPADPWSLAVAVKIDMTVADGKGHNITLSSLAGMRNL